MMPEPGGGVKWADGGWWMVGGFLPSTRHHPLSSLEIVLQGNLHRPGRHDRRRAQPAPAGDERLVVVEHGVGVQQVEEVDRDIRPHPPITNELADTEVDLVDTLT